MAPRQTFSITTTSPSSDGARTTVHVSGDLDLATAPDLAVALATSLADHPSALDVDMSEVTFMSCAGINVLILGRREARQVGGGLAVVRPSPVVDRFLSLGRTRSLLAGRGPAA